MFRVLIPEFNAWIDKSHLNRRLEGFCEVEVLSAASYPGEVLGFDVRDKESGGVYHNVPLSVLYVSDLPDPGVRPSLESCYYFNSPIGGIEVFKFPFKVAALFDRDKVLHEYVNYMFTIEWPEGNEIGHLVHNGLWFKLWPSHKLLFDSSSKDLPDWTKDRETRSLK